MMEAAKEAKEIDERLELFHISNSLKSTTSFFIKSYL